MQGNVHERGLKQSVDWSLVLSYLLLILIGWINIYASIHSSELSSIFDFEARSGKQFVWILTALGLAALILFILSPRLWPGMAVPLYLFVAVLLIAVIFLGTPVKGSRSWFQFGPVSFQPAEISKISTSLLLAMVMSRNDFKLSRFKDFLLVAAIIGVPMLSIVAESETGSALVYVGFIFVLYREGLSGWFLALIGLAIVLFITTLTASSYASILLLAGVLLLCNAFKEKNFWRWILFSALFVGLMAALPSIWNLITGAVSSAADRMANTVTVPLPGARQKVFGTFLLKIKPIYLLMAACLGALPYFAVRSFRERNNFMGLSCAAFVVGLALVFSTEFIFNDVLQDHQRKRIEVLLGMKEDPAGVGYNVNQSMIAIGSGGFAGKGYLQGTQTTYGFVPEQSTDFIFCTVGEEWGFIGCAVVILLYVFLISRLILDAEQCREPFTRIYGYCVASCIFMHLFINIGMTIGLMPVIGIPLPLLSYGGSSLWAFTIMIFIFVAMYREEKKYY
jgi:rod shape determining protein RodA